MIDGARGETWSAVESALRAGCRGLGPGSSLARLLAAERGARDVKAPPRLSEARVLAWADEHHARTGRWPGAAAGEIPGSGGETWCAVYLARHGRGGA